MIPPVNHNFYDFNTDPQPSNDNNLSDIVETELLNSFQKEQLIHKKNPAPIFKRVHSFEGMEALDESVTEGDRNASANDQNKVEKDEEKLPPKKRFTRASKDSFSSAFIPLNSLTITNQTIPMSLTAKIPFVSTYSQHSFTLTSIQTEQYQVVLSQHDVHPDSLEEKDAFILPLPFQHMNWLEVVKLAHSIMTLSHQDDKVVQDHLNEIRDALKYLPRDEIRKGEVNTLEQACLKGEHAVKFWKHLDALKQKIQTNLSFQTLYRMEFFDFSGERKYVLDHVANPEVQNTIRLYRKKKENGRYHYELLISHATPARRQTF